MRLFSRGGDTAIDLVAEHSVIVHFALESGPSGTMTDIASIAKLEAGLEGAIQQARAGEFDGSELGAGEVFLYAYGPNADRLFSAMEPILRAFPLRPGKALLRYGGYHDNSAPETVVNL